MIRIRTELVNGQGEKKEKMYEFDRGIYFEDHDLSQECQVVVSFNAK